ncbi:hypothetical protein Hanom_Chr12g01174221 [Helianthus anomalus]
MLSFILYRSYTENGVATTIRGTFLLIVRPGCSFISRSSSFPPFGNCQSNLCKRLTNKLSFVVIAKAIPGHPLLPAPNGIKSKS